jgi:hypothetical protein
LMHTASLVPSVLGGEKILHYYAIVPNAHAPTEFSLGGARDSAERDAAQSFAPPSEFGGGGVTFRFAWVLHNQRSTERARRAVQWVKLAERHGGSLSPPSGVFKTSTCAGGAQFATTGLGPVEQCSQPQPHGNIARRGQRPVTRSFGLRSLLIMKHGSTGTSPAVAGKVVWSFAARRNNRPHVAGELHDQDGILSRQAG